MEHEVTATEAKKSQSRKRWPIYVAVGVGVIALLGAGDYAYYHSRALPRTTVGSQAVSGLGEQQIATQLQEKFDQLRPEVSVNGKQVKVSYADLGVDLDAQSTAKRAVTKQSWTNYLLLWKSRQIEPTLKLNQDKLQGFLDKQVDSASLGGVPAKIELAEDGSGFKVTPSKPGQMPDAKDLMTQLKAAANQMEAGKFQATLSDREPDFDTAKAQQVVDQAMHNLQTDVEIIAGDKTFKPSDKDRLSFMKVETSESGTSAMNADNGAISDWVNSVIGKIDVSPKNRVQKVDPDGKPLGEPTEGKPGVAVQNADDLKAGVAKAIAMAQPAKLEAKTAQVEPKIKQVTIQPDAKLPEGPLAYDAADGEKWVDVNLSKHTITAFVGKTPVRGPDYMVNGKPDTPTVKGVFPVRAHVRSQTMRGPDYVTPGVPWVTYFHGDYALHGAPWRSSFGYAGRRGSHGCINLPVSVAKWYYEWTDIGTKVVTH